MNDITIFEETNGIARGWMVKLACSDSGKLRNDLRFILWELDEPDEDGHRSRSVVSITELDIPYVRKHLKPRAGLQVRWLKEVWSIDRIAPEPIYKALTEHEQRLGEEQAR